MQSNHSSKFQDYIKQKNIQFEFKEKEVHGKLAIFN